MDFETSINLFPYFSSVLTTPQNFKKLFQNLDFLFVFPPKNDVDVNFLDGKETQNPAYPFSLH